MRRFITCLLFLGTTLIASDASASWGLIKRYLQPDVVIVAEAPDRLVVRSPRLDRDVVIARERGPNVDLYAGMERRRKSNPHRVWTASLRLLNDPAIPRHRWGHLFRTPFLRIVRVERP